MAVLWIGSVFVHTNTLAFVVTAIITGVYGLGVIELLQYRRATATLFQALAAVHGKVTVLEKWLDQLDAALRTAVQARIEGERVGLPAPILTPYLVGLLIMLGLLGTFLGMVHTLQGTVGALEGSMDIQAIRAGLAAPIRGLGLAFGTSVAGVATSAMLGLMSALSRKDRILAARHLDAKAATVFQNFSLARNQQETLRALQVQTQALPTVAEKLITVADKLDHLATRLSADQERFHHSTITVYTELAAELNKTHKENVSESLRLTGATIQPILQAAVSDLAAETRHIHQMLTQATQINLQELTRHVAETSEEVSRSWKASTEAQARANAVQVAQMNSALDAFKGKFDQLAEAMLAALHQNMLSNQQKISDTLKETARELNGNALTTAGRLQAEVTRLLHSSEDLLANRMKVEESWLSQHSERMDALTTALRAELGVLRDDEERRGEAALGRLAALESSLSAHLITIGKGLEEPLHRLIRTAAEVPLAAAEVIGRLRQEAAKTLERDNRFLQEHQGLLAKIDTLASVLAATSNQQQIAIEQLIDSARHMLADISQGFSTQVGAEASNFSRIAEGFAVGAVEMASLGEAFSAAVTVFNNSNTNLVENLQRIEAALDQAAARSDEQLGYYVAQAREIIDHCMLSQKEIFEELQQLRPKNQADPEANEWKN